MIRNIELLAPGGDIDSIKAAIAAGADAVYCGLNKFNARNRAENITFENLCGILRLAHAHNCQIFITLNIIITENELPSLIGILNKLINTGIDGVIVQDLGVFYLLSNYFKGLKIHASTQLTTHNKGQLHFLKKLNATRVNLSRELNISEIKELTEVAHSENMLTEVFVHGSYCLSFSGICYASSIRGGNSGNRGRCSQPCRDKYLTTPAGKDYPLNLKDNSAFFDLTQLADAGVDSLKIEGRIKKSHYVYTIVDAWKNQLRHFYNTNKLLTDNSALYSVFNRDFSNAFLTGEISKGMFIDNPRDNSAIHLSKLNGGYSVENIEKAKGDIYTERTGIITNVESQIKELSIAKIPLTISVCGEFGTPLKIIVKTPETVFEVVSENNLGYASATAIDYNLIFNRLKIINDTEYYIERLDLDNLQPGLFVSYKDLTEIKKRILFILNGSRDFVEPIALPNLGKHQTLNINTKLYVLISSEKDIEQCYETNANICFQLPDCFQNEYTKLLELFCNNNNLIPWFPSILLGEDFDAAVEFLHHAQPKIIITNNTGIAYEAYKMNIPWIAGPYLNIVNSFSLLCLKENFNCSGAFISNEISKMQIKGIKNPENFSLFYSIYHPIVLMTSRQCLFHQVLGCEKNTMDNQCLQQCYKSASIKNDKEETMVIEKQKGNYHTIYNDSNFLNTAIIADVPDVFSGFLIDIRDVKTATKVQVDKVTLIKHFENLLNRDPQSEQLLQNAIYPTTNNQYKKGI